MLVIVSDIHLTDGTSGQTIRDRAFRVFRQRLRDLAYDASWRKSPENDGEARYEPIKTFDIILLGDILDVIRSDKWLMDGRKGVRPWHINQSAATNKNLAKKVAQITSEIIRNNKKSLAILKGLSSGRKAADWITLPPATPDGKPDDKTGWHPDDPDRVRVKVKIHYMAGNHEWFFNLPGGSYNEIRSKIKKAMGLANNPKAPFPYDPEESGDILKILAEHHVWARHGDIYDSFNYQDNQGRLASSLGDAIVIELVNRFPSEVSTLEIPQEVKDGMKEIDNVRPLWLIPLWIDGLLRRTGLNREQTKQVKAVWDRLVNEFLKIDFVKKQDSFWDPLDNVDKLEAMLKFSKGISLSVLGRILSWFDENVPVKAESYQKNAITESRFKNRTAQFIVYGHTHRHEIVPLDVTKLTSEKELGQIYLNTGTWRRVHTLARSNPRDAEFIGYNIMAYLAFFKDDERCGRAFEAWSGALGV
ncbi:MAG: hypothetical protein ACYTEK_01690 [Planctomycetota bacterium]